MLALVEPTIFSEVVDRPHLGCAMLIASCQEKGIKTALIKGQTRFLKDMFINDNEEIWNLIQDLKEKDLKKLKLKKSIQEIELKQFKDELTKAYYDIIVEKNLRNYFNSKKLENFVNSFGILSKIYFYYLNEINNSNLAIIERYVSEIIKTNPRYIGFSLQGSFGSLSRTIRKRIKELTGLPIVVGGALTSKISIKELDTIFENEYLDYLVIGPGENALPSLIEALESKKEPNGITNVFYRRNGKVKNNNIEVINNLDNLPFPDYHQFDLDLYLLPERVLSLQDARGCTWRQCAFCSHHDSSFGTYRAFSVERVIEIIRHLKKTYNCKHFILEDDELPPSRAKIISEAILSNKLKEIFIYTLARLTTGYNNNVLLQNLHKAGFRAIAWGMESASQKVLSLMNKGTNVSLISQIFKKSTKNGIANMCFVFFGFPGETMVDAQKTVKFLEKHADYIDNVNMQIFDLELGSPIQKNPERWGIKIKKDHKYAVRRGMSQAEVEDFFAKLKRRIEIGAIRIASGKINNKPHMGEQHTLHFLCSSHQLLFNIEALEYIKRRKLGRVFPVIMGDIEKKGNRRVFHPIDTKETIFFNSYFRKEELLDDIEERITILSDGKISIKEIISTIYREFQYLYDKEVIVQKCTAFFNRIFSENWGLAFAVSWGS
jgi:radical SAM superfamily enzyme YgiQ (UPF0313 family)